MFVIGASRKAASALGFVASISVAALAAAPARALPSFASQTGQPCSACHVGSFGPQLTPFGRAFKLHAYGATDSYLGGLKKFVPVSGMVIATFTHTAKDQSAPPANNMGVNDNFAVQEADLFLAGRLAPGLGVMIQATTDMIGHSTSLDNSEIRYAREFTVMGKSLVAGLSVNNSPTMQDVWNTTPTWRFPYVTSALALTPIDAPLLTGALAHQVVGESAYLWVDEHLYLEAGNYESLSAYALNILHEDDFGRVSGAAPYGRAAWSQPIAGQTFEIGVFGMDAKIEPTRVSGPTDHYDDVGVDGSWQLLGTGKHVFSVNTSYIQETRRLDASYGLTAANQPKDWIGDFALDASYYYDARWGLSAGLFHITGTADTGLYAPLQDVGSRTGKPDSSGYTLQADWTPFGGAKSWGAPWANVRLGVQYTGYTRFNGAVTNYDGFGRNAADNDTTMAFVWTAF
jgi:hypothetical protein